MAKRFSDARVGRPAGFYLSRRRPVWRLAVAGLLAGLAGLATNAQPTERFLSRTSPNLPFPTPEPAKYNLKWRKLTARFHAGTQVEFNDNITLTKQANADLMVGPTLGIGFVLPVTEMNTLQLDFGLGYRWYLKNTSLSTFTLAPDSHLDYRMWIKEVAVNFHDDFTIQVDPTGRPELGNQGERTANYRRFVNTIGANATWQPKRDWSVIAGYDYTFDRSLTDDFQELDRNSHSLNAASYYMLSPRWTAGLYGLYSITDYVQQIQNNAWMYSIGPVLTYRPTKFISLDALVAYTYQGFEPSGTVTDISTFSGITYQAGIRHTINSRMSHNLRFRRSVSPGYNSNFTDTYSIQYGLSRKLTQAITLNANLAYETFTSSGSAGDQADRYMLYVGTHFQVSRRLVAGLGYAVTLKESATPDGDYTQNRVTVDLTYQF